VFPKQDCVVPIVSLNSSSVVSPRGTRCSERVSEKEEEGGRRKPFPVDVFELFKFSTVLIRYEGSQILTVKSPDI
jgi:hypothetical protein